MEPQGQTESQSTEQRKKIMGINLTPIAKNLPTVTASKEVSEDVKQAFVESWNYIQKNPEFDMEAVFTTREERNQFITQLTAYAVTQGVYVRQVRGSNKDKDSTAVKYSMEDNTKRLARVAELKVHTDAIKELRDALVAAGTDVPNKAKGTSLKALAESKGITIPTALL